MKKVLWEELRRPEFEQALAGDAVVIIPVGSTEQHGDHLPVNTDANSCFQVAKRAAEAIDDFPVLVMPPIWTGYSLEHMAYPGAISLKHHTFVELLSQVAVSVYTHGFKKILFLNGHGGNTSVVAAMRTKLAYEESFPPSLALGWWEFPALAKEAVRSVEKDIGPHGPTGHAGEIETSVQLYLQPELVDKDAMVWSKGVFGDPAYGTMEKGERLISAAVNGLVQVLKEYHDGKIDDGWGWREECFVGRKDVQ